MGHASPLYLILLLVEITTHKPGQLMSVLQNLPRFKRYFPIGSIFSITKITYLLKQFDAILTLYNSGDPGRWVVARRICLGRRKPDPYPDRTGSDLFIACHYPAGINNT